MALNTIYFGEIAFLLLFSPKEVFKFEGLGVSFYSQKCFFFFFYISQADM